MSIWEIFFFISSAITSAYIVRPGQSVDGLPNAQALATQQVIEYGNPVFLAPGDGEQTASAFLDAGVLPVGHPAGSKQAPFDPPRLPLGHWNEAHMRLDSHTRTLNFTNTTRTSQLEIIAWHPREIDYLEFVNVETLQQGRMQVVTHPDFDVPILIKIASSSTEIPSLEREIVVYRLLHNSGVTPEFLGHVTEGGRVIGFITEYIWEVPSIRDRSMKSCLAALHGFHQKGIAHGDAHEGNCLIREDGSAVLIDFELSVETLLPEEFERDLDIMGRCIQASLSLLDGDTLRTKGAS